MVAPKISSARNYPFPTTIEVFFTQEMSSDNITNPNVYNLNLGAYVTSVEAMGDPVSWVRLTVENLFGYPEFVLSVSDGFLFNVSLEALDTSVTATINLDLADESIYAISASNGMLKTGRVAKQVSQDDDNFYIRTETGVDVVDKTSLFNKGYILRSGGLNTIFIGGE